MYTTKDSKVLSEFDKVPHRKLIGKRYVVEIQSVYFDNYHVSVEDMQSRKSAYTWIGGIFNDKTREGKSAESLYLYLNSPKKCKDFIDGKIVRVSDKGLPSEVDKWGINKLFDTHM